MYKVSVLYPNPPGSRFDIEYYARHPMRLVRDLLTAEGLVKIEIDRGIGAAPGQPPAYHCIGSLYFRDADGFGRGIQKHGTVPRADIPNFTDVTPVRQLSEVLA